MKLRLLAASAAVTIGAASAAQAECGEISITEGDWASTIVVTEIASFILEQGYGCDVKRILTSSTPALVSVVETGEPQILTEMWTNGIPSYDGMIERKEVIELTEVLSDGGVEAMWVPKYIVDEHPEAATIDGIIANPELVGGRYHNCPDGWTCKIIGRNILTAAGAEEAGLEIFDHGSGETLAAAIAAAYANKEPWFGYYWAPTSVLGKYPMVQVNLGEVDRDIHACNSDENCAEPGVAPWPSSKVVTVVTAAFADSHPDETELMSNLSFTNEVMGGLLAWQEDNNASGEETAVYFLTNFKDVWGGWLNDDARTKLSALLQ